MSLSASCESVSQKRTLSSLLAGRVVKKPKQGDGRRLQEAAIQLLEQQQDLCSLFREVGDGKQNQILSTGISSIAGSMLASELRRRAAEVGVSVAVLSVKMVLERLREITEDENERRQMLMSSRRVQLCVLLESSRELQSQGSFNPKLLWQEYRRDQRLPKLEVVYHLHFYNILSLKYIIESDDGARSWLVSQLKALCEWTPPQEEEETKRVQLKVLSTVVGVLVGTGFDLSHEPASADRRTSLLCCSVLDDMLYWLLDSVEKSVDQQSAGAGVELWFLFSLRLINTYLIR